MKRIITANGNEELNNILKRQKDIIVESKDIQYQEGIIEALDKYKDLEYIILSEDIIGNLELEDLIRTIVMLKSDIKIILITNEEIDFECKNVENTVKNNEDYVKNVLKYFFKDIDIKVKNETLKEEKTKYKNTLQTMYVEGNVLIDTKEMLMQMKKKLEYKEAEVISIIGISRVR